MIILAIGSRAYKSNCEIQEKLFGLISGSELPFFPEGEIGVHRVKVEDHQEIDCSSYEAETGQTGEN